MALPCVAMHYFVLPVPFYLILAAACLSPCSAKVINTDASSSYLTKVKTGVIQSAHWLWNDFFGGGRGAKAGSRPPRKVELALVGLGRTGSTSFSAALKQLGYAPIHDDEATEVADIYKAMMDKSLTMEEVNEKLGERGFDAPMVSLPEYVEWAATAPDVKVILTVRDKSKWAQSWLTVVPAASIPYKRPFVWLQAIRDLADFNWMIMVTVPTNGHPEKYNDIPTLEAGFEAWTEYVKRTVPEDRLLIFDVRQGWEPLCNFLDKPIPDGKFPHINDRVVVDIIIKIFVLITYIWPFLIALPLLVAYLIVRWCFNRRKRTKETPRRKAD